MRGAALSVEKKGTCEGVCSGGGSGEKGGGAKIGNFEGFIFVQKKVFRLEIAVVDAVSMAVPKTFDELTKEEAGVWF